MIFHVLSVRDRGADVFGVPSFHTSIGGATRAFGDEINRADANNTLYKHPEDFDLFVLGTYDDNTGQFDCHLPRQVAVGKDLVIKK